MSDFKDVREAFDDLTTDARSWIKKKSISKSIQCLEKAEGLLSTLREISSGDLQKGFVLSRTYELESLAGQIDGILSKREAGKRQDGNIALKCNWNDKHFKAPCGTQAYTWNLAQGRAWCSSPQCKCRESNGKASIESYPCYESIALKEMYFGAGWDHTGERFEPRHIYSAREERIAVLTTREPGSEERDRIIIGCLLIEKLVDDPGEETKIFGHKSKSLDIDYDKVRVNFWDYYKNAGDENLILWASGLFRYISDETVLNILMGIGEQYKNLGKDVSRIIPLVRHFEEIVDKKNILRT
jgi:hypothetical protein